MAALVPLVFATATSFLLIFAYLHYLQLQFATFVLLMISEMSGTLLVFHEENLYCLSLTYLLPLLLVELHSLKGDGLPKQRILQLHLDALLTNI